METREAPPDPAGPVPQTQTPAGLLVSRLKNILA